MIWISRVMLLFTLSWGFTYFLCKFKHFWLNFAFQIFWNCYRFVGVSYYIFLFCIFVFSCALLSCSFLKCWLNLQNPISLSWQILHLFFWCSKIHFFIIELATFFQESFTSSWLIRFFWDKGRVDKEKKQLWNNKCSL